MRRADMGAHEARAAAIFADLAPLERALSGLGVSRNGTRGRVPRDADAVPVLLDHLARPCSDAAIGTIAAALIPRPKHARAHWQEIAAIYRARGPSQDGADDTLAPTLLAILLSATFTTPHLAALFVLIADPALGETRVILLQPLRRRRKRPEVRAFLAEAIRDPCLAAELATWKPPLG